MKNFFHLKFLGLALIVFLIPFLSTAQQQSNSLTIGLIADIQYADKPSKGTRFYRESLSKLDHCVETLNTHKTNFNIVFGDLVDEGPKDLKPIEDRLNQLDSAHYTILGNHDYPSSHEDLEIHKKFGMPSSYYSILRNDWLFIFLNSNELSEYAIYNDPKQEKALQEMMSTLKSNQRKNATSYNGGISKKQLKFLIHQLELAKKNHKKVIVCTHHPLFPENGLEALNNREILEILQKATHVKAVLAGHHHSGNYALYKDLPIITLEGMVETEKENAFGILELQEKTMNIQGFGKLTSRTITYR